MIFFLRLVRGCFGHPLEKPSFMGGHPITALLLPPQGAAKRGGMSLGVSYDSLSPFDRERDYFRFRGKPRPSFPGMV